MKGHEKVESKILSLDEWQNRFHCIIEKIHKKASHDSFSGRLSNTLALQRNAFT
jgi:hypothetical protein